VECKKKRMVPRRGDSMRPNLKERIAEGLIEGFYVIEVKGKNDKRVRRGALCARSQKEKWQKVA
jgi:hypothetical protein